MSKFQLKTDYSPKGDQPEAIKKLSNGIVNNKKYQVLLGVTGSGKTFTVAKVIEKLNMPALIISHNKTLAAQLYQEFRDFFPNNKVSYFVSYYDYYQPEAYIPSTDTYIEKDSDINEMIDKLRLAATTNILTSKDVVVVASVSAIYNIGNPKEYGNFVLELKKGMKISIKAVIDRLTDLQYLRSDYSFQRSTFRVLGDIVDVYLAYEDCGIKIEFLDDYLSKITKIDPLSGEIIEKDINAINIFPTKHYITDTQRNKDILVKIKKDLKDEVDAFKSQGRLLEATRLHQKVSNDLDMIYELGYVKGIENYSRYFDGRNINDPPYTLIDYFNEAYGNNWLMIIDESHITFPQIKGMYEGDRSRKQTLIDYGFRLKAALDNRPLKFDEYLRIIPNFIAVSATPANFELTYAKDNIVEQLVRPTGIVDPLVEIRPVDNEIKDVIEEIKKRVDKGQRSLVTTLTKKTAEDVSEYLNDLGLKVQYLHSDVKTLERTDILDKLRSGHYDVLIGVNLLREGLDLPEVTLVAILDADKEGFLRSVTSLIQTMGRAARHIEGKVILYANKITDSMKNALKEVERRRIYQIEWNKKHNITPKSITKPIREKLIDFEFENEKEHKKNRDYNSYYKNIDPNELTPVERKKVIFKLRKEMKNSADALDFELAIEIRNKILELEK